MALGPNARLLPHGKRPRPGRQPEEGMRRLLVSKRRKPTSATAHPPTKVGADALGPGPGRCAGAAYCGNDMLRALCRKMQRGNDLALQNKCLSVVQDKDQKDTYLSGSGGGVATCQKPSAGRQNPRHDGRMENISGVSPMQAWGFQCMARWAPSAGLPQRRMHWVRDEVLKETR